MQNELGAWIGVAIIGLMNLRAGFLFAIWDKPRAVVGHHDFQKDVLPLIIGISLGLGLIVLSTGVLSLTVVQAATLSFCCIAGYAFAVGFVGSGQPPIAWPKYLNARVDAVRGICQRHGWDPTRPEELARLAAEGRIRFDEHDLEVIVQLQSDQDNDLGSVYPPPVNRDGTPDYDRACAREIVNLANALGGFRGTPGIIDRIESDYDLSDFNRAGFNQMRTLADKLVEQWGESLHAP